jgi:hypothetical protein
LKALNPLDEDNIEDMDKLSTRRPTLAEENAKPKEIIVGAAISPSLSPTNRSSKSKKEKEGDVSKEDEAKQENPIASKKSDGRKSLNRNLQLKNPSADRSPAVTPRNNPLKPKDKKKEQVISKNKSFFQSFYEPHIDVRRRIASPPSTDTTDSRPRRNTETDYYFNRQLKDQASAHHSTHNPAVDKNSSKKETSAGEKKRPVSDGAVATKNNPKNRGETAAAVSVAPPTPTELPTATPVPLEGVDHSPSPASPLMRGQPATSVVADALPYPQYHYPQQQQPPSSNNNDRAQPKKSKNSKQSKETDAKPKKKKQEKK